MTQDEFDKLPMLLSRSQVLACGVPDRALRGCVVEWSEHAAGTVPKGKIGVVRPRDKYALYRKVDVGRMVGFT